jgi:2-keto-4-pentenoate hydratase/2-oxohepta-3-ene-1,7-dioic acid hydratase in catechol pathway
VPDPHALDLRLTISGNVLQHSHTRELIFRVPDLIQYFSAITRLEAGDIISTGTPRALELDALLVAGCVRGDDRYRGGRPRPVS